MIWSIKVYLSSGTVDLCNYNGRSLVVEKSIKVVDGGWDKDLSPTRGTASFDVAYNTALASSLISQTARPKVEVICDGVALHTGLLRPTEQYTFSNSLEYVSLSTVDYWDLLDQDLGHDLALSGVVSRAAGGSDSIVHRLVAMLTSVTIPTVVAVDNLAAVPGFSASSSDKVGDVLKAVMIEHLMLVRFDGQGRLVVRAAPGAGSTVAFGDLYGQLAIDNKTLKVSREDVTEDSVRVKFWEMSSESQDVRYSAQSIKWGLVGTEVLQKAVEFDSLPAGRLVSQSNFRVYVEWVDDSEEGIKGSFYRHSGWVDLASGNLGIIHLGFDPSLAGASLTLSSNTPRATDWNGNQYNVSIYITSLVVYADYTYATQSRESSKPGPAKVYKTVEAKYLFDEAASAAYAARIQSRLGGGGYTFAWDSPTSVDVGTVVTIQGSRDGFLSVALITGKAFSQSSRRYAYKGVLWTSITVDSLVTAGGQLSSPDRYELSASVAVVSSLAPGILSPSAITFTALRVSRGVGMPFLGAIAVEKSFDGVSFDEVISLPDVSSLSYSPTTERFIRATLTAATGDFLGSVVVPIVNDERVSIKQLWHQCLTEKPVYDNLADTYAVVAEKTVYDSAFQALADYLNGSLWTAGTPGWIQDPPTCSVDGAQWESRWLTYNLAKGGLRTACTASAKAYVGTTIAEQTAAYTPTFLGLGASLPGSAVTGDTYILTTDEGVSGWLWRFDGVNWVLVSTPSDSQVSDAWASIVTLTTFNGSEVATMLIVAKLFSKKITMAAGGSISSADGSWSISGDGTATFSGARITGLDLETVDCGDYEPTTAPEIFDMGDHPGGDVMPDGMVDCGYWMGG